jgi:hypothetical protein
VAVALGTRLWVFDKPRIDPHEPNRFGATITYDIPLRRAVIHRTNTASTPPRVPVAPLMTET